MTGVRYSIEENYTAPKWTVSSESKNIGGYTCQKATTTFHGREWEAWFCPQLAYPSGPWKLTGLPGLILEAYDTRKEIQFGFQSLTDTSSSTIQMPDNVTKTTHRELITAIEARYNGAGAAGPTMGTISAVTVGAAKSGKRRVFNNFYEKKY